MMRGRGMIYPLKRRELRYCDKCGRQTDHLVTVWSAGGKLTVDCLHCASKPGTGRRSK